MKFEGQMQRNLDNFYFAEKPVLKSQLYQHKEDSMLKKTFGVTYGALDSTSLSTLHNVAAEQVHSLLVERLFLGCAMSRFGLMAHGTASKVFGLELKTLFRDHKIQF